MRNTCKILVRKSEEKETLGRTRCRWEDNIKMDLEETGREGVEWIQLTEYGPVTGSCEHGSEPISLGAFAASELDVVFSGYQSH
jgi:hypothetical protein